ncbi:MAG: DUF1937 family protein [Chloroflexi bacterium]|nr:MAG: DUF1937 family protein [Chloroflexota bacterium]
MRIYLAGPFYHKCPAIMEMRFLMLNYKAGELIRDGHIVFSPISHSWPIQKEGLTEHTHEVWLKQDYAFIEWCDELWVLDLPGWEESFGVSREVEYATSLHKPAQLIGF